jgi:hypothetical protein
MDFSVAKVSLTKIMHEKADDLLDAPGIPLTPPLLDGIWGVGGFSLRPKVFWPPICILQW